MTQEERLDVLLRCLLEEYEEVRVPDSLPEKRQLLRSLMNVRPPAPASKDFLKVQDAYLGELLAQRGVLRCAKRSGGLDFSKPPRGYVE